MKKAIAMAIVLLSAVLMTSGQSCPRNQYDIVMISKDGTLERTLTATLDRDSNEEAQAEVAALRKLYQTHKVEANGRENVFTGLFRGRTPNDVGGAGFHAYADSPLGSVTAYVEQFRGSDDLLQQVETRMKAVDRLVDIFTGWLKTQVGTEKDFDKLAAFLDKDVRRDMKNVSLYIWMVTNDLVRVEKPAPAPPNESEAASQPASGPATADDTHLAEETADEALNRSFRDNVARVSLYLLEKGYFEPKDAVLLQAATSGSDQEKPKAIVALVEKVLANKAGIGNKALIARLTGFCTDSNAVEASLLPYLRETPEFEKLLAERKAAAAKDPNVQEPDDGDAMKVLSQYGSDWFGLEILGPSDDELRIRLACPVEPIWTNGVWDGNALTWSRMVRRAGAPPIRMPAISYAVWAVPNEEFQNKHFGGVVLTGDSLMEYCLWRMGLSVEDTRRWDAMVAGLSPGAAMWTTLNEFGLPKDGLDPFEKGRNLLLNALTGSPATQPAGPTTSPGGAATADGNGVQTVTFQVVRNIRGW